MGGYIFRDGSVIEHQIEALGWWAQVWVQTHFMSVDPASDLSRLLLKMSPVLLLIAAMMQSTA